MGIQRCIVKGHLFGAVETRNIFHGYVTLGEGDTDVTMWEAYLGDIIGQILDITTTAWTVELLELQNRVGTEFFTVAEWSFPAQGHITGDAIANLVAAVMVGVPALSHSHGRKFWSGIAESMVDGNQLTSAGMIAFVGAVASYVATYTSGNGGTLVPGILDKNGVWKPFVSGFASVLLGSMRRRKPGLGI